MAARDMWKMLHLLNIYGPSLEREVVRAAGITCDPDTIYPLISSGVIEAIPNDVPWYQASHYRLSNTAMSLAQSFLLANKRDTATDVRVDEARAFVIMPFSEQWSSNVYSNLIEPAVRAAGFQCIRGDLVVRSGDLTANILNEILIMGIAVVDVSARNPNVFYELGLCHAIGKDTLLIKQAGTVMPADLAGAHYSEYTLTDIKRGRDDLEKMLNDWAVKNSVKRT